LVIGGGTYRWAFAEGNDGGVGATTITGGSFSPSGTNLVFKQLCPSTEADAGTVIYPYATPTTGDGFYIYGASNTLEYYEAL
jgi:hypothetical protein